MPRRIQLLRNELFRYFIDITKGNFIITFHYLLGKIAKKIFSSKGKVFIHRILETAMRARSGTSKTTIQKPLP